MGLTISRILVPVDFSAYSERALDYAIALAARLDASLHLLHVVEDPMVTGALVPEGVMTDFAELRAELMADAEQRLLAYRGQAERAGVPVVTAARWGFTSATILEYAAGLNIDLVVMGTHGRTGMAHLLMGSVAERVVRQAACPVLTVRHGVGGEEQVEPLEHAVVGSRQ
jgi:nucleotide-binding universal stress UspA family protein